MIEILQALKLLPILILYPLYFIGYTYNFFHLKQFRNCFEYYLEKSWYKIIFLIIWILIFFFGVLC
jgi:hypothetical protein